MVVEPVAVVGIGCRLPGDVASPEDFWDLLSGGRAAVGEVPPERWSGYADLGPDYAAALRRATRKGSFLTEIDGFDAEFFGLTPREAELMDPQQRILLEVAWEALEHAGIAPTALAGTDAGVFVGIGSDDYGRRLLEDLPGIEAWTGIGASMCAAANRVSYALDLRGPSMAVDTACSASLVATHLACQSLRLGDSTIALVGGVNLIVSPGLTLTLDAAGAMAGDGRSKAFDASADGYGRGEGCAVLVLKRLSDARRDGDRVLALVRGSAVNQDGRTNGIMSPSAGAQRHVIERACHNAGVEPGSVAYVEAHGTGTKVGDPLEASALASVYGTGRASGEPCLIGSVKTNIGHLEAGAGAASLVKAVLALAHDEIPPSLNHSTGNPEVEWDATGLRVVTEPTPWPASPGPRRAGVSGFGYGGTIAHVVLEQAPTDEPAEEPTEAGPGEEPRLYPLSAASPAALREQAAELARRLPLDGTPLASVGHTLALRRAHLEHRAAVVAASREELAAGLRGLAEGTPSPGTVTGTVTGSPPGGDGTLVWVFSGHGSQWAGMGRELLAGEPEFASVIDVLEPVFLEEIGFSPRQVLAESDLAGVDRIQTMIFAMQVGLAALWRAAGVNPDAVIGHSVGEIAAAVTAGALSLEDGARLICRRSVLLREVAGRGAMAMAALPFDQVRDRLAGREGVTAAIASAPESTVISGAAPAVERLIADWQAEGVHLRRVASDVAFHSPDMDPLLSRLIAAARDLGQGPRLVPMYTTALDDPRATPALDGEYWAANLRNPVRLRDAVQAAAEDGHRLFIEISPHPVVTHSIGETLSGGGFDPTFTGTTLRRALPERVTLLAAVGAAHAHGARVDWARLQPDGRPTTLPGVAWQRRRHWREPSTAGRTGGLGHDVDAHSLLGTPVPVAGRPLGLWRTQLTEDSRPYPGRHTVNGVEIVPAAVLINSFLGAAERSVLRDLAMVAPLVVADRREVQVIGDGSALRLASRSADGGRWLAHASAVAGGHGAELPERLPPETGRGLERSGSAAIHRHLASVGVPGMGFEWTVEELWRGLRSLRARIKVVQPAVPTWAPVLDAVLSAAPLTYPGDPVLRLASGLGELVLDGPPPRHILGDLTYDPAQDVVDVVIADADDGRVVARLAGLRYTSMEGGSASAAPRQLVHELAWRPLDLPDSGRERTAVIVTPDSHAGAALRDRLIEAGITASVTASPEGLAEFDAPADVLVLPARFTPASTNGAGGAGSAVTEGAARSAWLLAATAKRLAATAGPTRLWCLTSGVMEAAEEPSLAHAPLWGLGRVLAGEHPEMWGGIVDLDPNGDADGLDRILAANPREDVLALRGGAASVSRLARLTGEPPGQDLECRADGTYLITGGLGALGLEIARWLAGRGARRIVLAGRTPFPARADWDAHDEWRARVEGVRALEAMGVTVRLLTLDIADAGRAAELLALDSLGLPAIRGVVHAAGVLDNRLLHGLDEESLRAIMRPKVEGAWTLHTLFPPGSLDFMVFFSSCGQLLQIPGQTGYGAANAFLDALAVHRRASGHRDTLSLGWTSWQGRGMAVNEFVDLELRAKGVGGITADDAFGAWDLAQRHRSGYLAIVRAVPLETGGERLPILSELATEDDAGTPARAAGRSLDELAGLSPEELRERLLDEVGAQIAGEMRLPESLLDARRSLAEQGLDSVMTMAVRRRLELRFGHTLPATLLWHQPTVAAIADHLVELLSAAPSEILA